MEIITRGERRRSWTLEEKRAIVAESLGPELTPTEVARKHAISTGQLYAWRRHLLGMQSAVVARAVPRFAEVAMAADAEPMAAAAQPSDVTVPSGTAAINLIACCGSDRGDPARRRSRAGGRRCRW
jgi:transposase